MNTTHERWIMVWDVHRPKGMRSPVSTGFSRRDDVRRQLATLEADRNVRTIWVTRVVPVVRWMRGHGTVIEQLDAFPIDEVEPLRWNLVWCGTNYTDPRMPDGTWFHQRENLRKRVSMLERVAGVDCIYVTHVCDVTGSLQRAADAVTGFDAFLRLSRLPEASCAG